MKITVFCLALLLYPLLSIADVPLFSTRLRVTVIDGLGNFVEGATVSIYDNEADYRESKNAVAILETNKKGKVIFSKLKPIAYYIEASFEDKNNNGEGVLTEALAKGRSNKVNTIIE